MEQTLTLAEPSSLPRAEGRKFGSTLFQLIRDFRDSMKRSGFWLYSSWIETLLSYRSTVLGPLWILVGSFTFVFFVGMLYGRVVLSDVGASNVYLAYLAIGFTFWLFVTQSFVGSCSLFSKNRSDILDGDLSYTDLICKLLTKNFIDVLHSLPVIIVAMVVTHIVPTLTALWVLITLPLLVLNVVWICSILSILGARYPDIEEFVHSSLRLLFFITPIMWIPHQHIRGPIVDALLYLNPFYYLVEIIRAPLVYGHVPYFEMAVLFTALPIGWLAASSLYARTRPWLALWL